MNKLKNIFKDKELAQSVSIGILLLLASTIVNYFAGIYATERASNYVNDIILSNIPVYNVDGIFIYGPFLFWFFIAYLCIKEPRRIPFVLKSIALFVVIRSIFVILTHMAPYPYQAEMDAGPNLLKMFTTGNDLFFSGHTGLPFLMALLFWQKRKLSVAFICVAVFFGAIVLMAHFHYSIDVLAAFFITYTIYHIANIFFPKDKKMFQEGLQT